MSKNEVKKLAKKYIEDQKQILESHGDSVVRSKYKQALEGAQKTFEILTTSARSAGSTHTKIS